MRETDRESSGILRWSGKLGLIAMLLFWLVVMAMSWAQGGAEAAEIAGGEVDLGPKDIPSSLGSSSDRAPLLADRAPAAASSAGEAKDNEYSFDWLDPDKKIYVLQNRKYLKSSRVLLSAMGGPALSGNAYRTTYSLDGRAGYYFKEFIGIEVFYARVFNVENTTYEALKIAAPNTLPEVRETRAQFGALVHYAPWYAKINVFNQILYFDWYLSGGGGAVQTAVDQRSSTSAAPSFREETLFGLFAGTGHQYHLSRLLTVRLDVTGVFYRATYSRNLPDQAWFSNFLFGAGVGIRL